MKLTLYKNCIVKDSYAEVFSPSAFESYLNTLASDDITVDTSYPTLRGRIQIDFSTIDSPFKYNYMKIEAQDQNDNVYYCFIDSVNLIGDELAELTFSVDVWHTYIKNTYVRNSTIGYTKYLPSGSFGYLPIPYETNDPIVMEELDTSATRSKVGLIVELQTYKTIGSEVSGDDDRQCHIACVMIDKIGEDYNNATAVNQEPRTAALDLNQAEAILQGLMRNAPKANGMAVLEWNPTNFVNALKLPGGAHHFEIVNAYLVPALWLQKISRQYTMSKTFMTNFEFDEHSNNARSILQCSLWLFLDTITDTSSGTIQTYEAYPGAQWRSFYTQVIPHNYKNIAIGCFSNPIPLSNNGLDKEIELKVSIDAFNLNIGFTVEGKFYDVTPFYSVDIPFTSINGETAQLRRVADREKRSNAIAKIVGSVIASGVNVAGTWLGASNGTPSATLISKIGNTAQEAGSLTTNIWTAANAIKAATENKYQTTYSQEVDIVGAVNAIYGLILFKMGDVYNQDEVTYAINNIGYETSIIAVNGSKPWDPFNLSTTVHYNPIKYSYINLYGEAPQNIARELERILTRGTRVIHRLGGV